MDYTKSQIDKIGEKFVKKLSLLPVEEQIFELWRKNYQTPMNNLRNAIVTKLKANFKQKYSLAQRLKRKPTILSKIIKAPKMQLSRMDDIAGIRIILNCHEDLLQVQEILKSQKELSKKIKFELVKIKNYVNSPKSSGYRGIHLIYAYTSNNKKQTIELQLRTRLQHVWASTVELISSMENGDYKREMPSAWVPFFNCFGTSIEEYETLKPIKGSQIVKDLTLLVKKHQLFEKIKLLKQSSVMKDKSDNHRDGYYLIVRENESNLYHFPLSNFDDAFENYIIFESSLNVKDVVLVSVSSLRSLYKTYSSYFDDTEQLEKLLKDTFKIKEETLISRHVSKIKKIFRSTIPNNT